VIGMRPEFLMITNDPMQASIALDAGVDRIFIDLEIIGKEARQGHLNTVISRHSLNDLYHMRAQFPTASILTRINPVHPGTSGEVEQVLRAGTNWIMLPMFREATEVLQVSSLIAGRALYCPLVETLEACDWVASWSEIPPGLDALYFGLNDLHLALGRHFMFSVLFDTRIRRAIDRAAELGIPFGFGGIATRDGGQVSGYQIAALHVTLGSRAVILSRAFHQLISETRGDFHREVEILSRAFDALAADQALAANVSLGAKNAILTLEESLS